MSMALMEHLKPMPPPVDPQALAAVMSPGQRAVSFPTPIISDLLFQEDIDVEGTPSYLAMPRGTPYPDQTRYPGFRLVQEIPLSHRVHRFTWANDRINQDAWNYSIQYVNEAGGYPIFIRQYVLPRIGYTRATDKAAFTGLIRIDLSSGGSGYTADTVITFSAGTATAIPKIVNGVLRQIILTSEGTGYDSASLPTVIITDSGGGTGAAAVAVMQPKGAILIKEDMQELPPEDPRHSDSVQVIRIYETLPGPVLTSLNALDGQAWGGSTTTTQQEVSSGTTATAGAFTVLGSEVQAKTANVSEKTVKVIDNGGWPTLTEFHVDSQSGIIIRIVKQMVDAAVVSAIPLNEPPGTNEGAGAGNHAVLAPGLIITPGTSFLDGAGTVTPDVTGLWSLQGTWNAKRFWLIIVGSTPYFLFYNAGQWNVAESFVAPILWQLVTTSSDPSGAYAAIGGTGTLSIALAYTDPVAQQIEHQPFDEYRTIQLVSQIGQLPDDEQYPDVVQISLPSILNSAEVDEAWAFTTDKEANAAALQKNITTGYSGPANATVYRSYSFGPPISIPTVTSFWPKEDSVFWYWWYANTGSDYVDAQARTFEFPPTLHDAISIDIGGSISGAGHVSDLAATSPTGYASGQQIVHAAQVQKMQMGIYLLEYVIATIPAGL